MTAQFDQEYLRRLQRGDPPTESHFSAYFSDLLFFKLRNRVRSRQMLAEVRQETFLRVLQAVRNGAVEHPERFGAFVASVCNHVLLEYLRSEDRWGGNGERPVDPIDERVEMDRELISRELTEKVAVVLAELSEKDRDVLRMLFLEERDKSEVCRKLNVEPDYLRVVVHRAKTRFRDRFIENDGGIARR